MRLNDNNLYVGLILNDIQETTIFQSSHTSVYCKLLLYSLVICTLVEATLQQHRGLWRVVHGRVNLQVGSSGVTVVDQANGSGWVRNLEISPAKIGKI